MSELEAAQLGHVQFEQAGIVLALAQSQVSITITQIIYSNTLLAGYLVAAYLVGANLSRMHVSILNSFFAVTYVQIAHQVIENTFAAREMTLAYLELSNVAAALPITMSLEYIGFGIITFTAVLVAALYFMWSIRHPKTE
ncbi:MAG: hypothetical protein V7711_17250 [Pseudomonadales bacterium]